MKTVLVTLSFAVEVPDEGYPETAFAAGDRVEAAVKAALPGLERPLGWQTTGYVDLTTPGINCGRCAECGGWVTDVTKPERVDGLGYGAVWEGRLLCDEHLPKDHAAAF